MAKRRSQKPMCSNSTSNSAPAASQSSWRKSKLSRVSSRGHRRVEEPRAAEVDAAEELPVALERGIEHAVERLAGKALQQLVQAARAEHQQHHQAVMVGQASG